MEQVSGENYRGRKRGIDELSMQNERMGLYAATIAEALIKQNKTPDFLLDIEDVERLGDEYMQKIITLGKSRGIEAEHCRDEIQRHMFFIRNAVIVIIAATKKPIKESREAIKKIAEKAGADLSIQ